MVAATLRTVFAQPDQASAHETIERICRLFEKRYPQLVKVVQEAEVDVLAYFSFPSSTGGKSGQRIRSSVSTKRSAGVVMWSASFLIEPRYCD
jgi:transposase-like protein